MMLRGVLARKLRRLRRAGRLSQEELAAQAGLNRNYVGMIEREEHAATVDVLEQLAAAFAIEPAELLQSGSKVGSSDQVLSK